MCLEIPQTPSVSSFPLLRVSPSIHLDSPINPPHKRIRRQKPHRPRQQPINAARQKAIIKEQQSRNKPRNLELGIIKHDAIAKDPEARTSTNEDALPPPVVVFLAEHNVCGHDGDFDNREDADEGDDGEEAEDIVVARFVLPQATEDKEEFDEDDGEGDEAGNEARVDALGVPCLLRDRPWDGSCFGWMFVGLALVETVPAAHVDKRELDEEH